MAFASVTTSSDRGASALPADAVERRFASLRAEGRKALVCYLTAGHPSPEVSVELLRAVADAGADVIELGVPFSDPMADGPVIQASSQRALDHGFTFERTLALVRDAVLDVPVVLFSYLNPIFAAGPDALQRAADAGVRGILITDLPVGADPKLERWLSDGPLAYVRLVAPTTPAARMREIGLSGRGFVYLISRMGVTGIRDDLPPDLAETMARLRASTTLPVCVGFGISRPEQARAVADLADGVVVGSALVQAADRGGVPAAAELVRALRAGLDAR
jgi:tryptophan synthase alpha chain